MRDKKAVFEHQNNIDQYRPIIPISNGYSGSTIAIILQPTTSSCPIAESEPDMPEPNSLRSSSKPSSLHALLAHGRENEMGVE
jgi:hypothetical protein